MKRAFLVPTAVAIAALTQSANAKQPETGHKGAPDAKPQPDDALATSRNAIETSGKELTPYSIGDQLFGFVIERTGKGEVVADHFSHSSHASHASHASSSY